MPHRPTLPLSDALLALLAPHAQGLRVLELRQALRPQPPYGTLYGSLRTLCDQGLVVRVAWGRYTLASAFRALQREVDARSRYA